MLDRIRSNAQRRDQDGGSAVEYALLIAGIATVIVAIVFLFGGVVKSQFSKTCGKLSSSGTSSTATC